MKNISKTGDASPREASPRYGTLYIVATPIGNLEDITLRALRVLKEADLIACEDTRVTRKLLEHFDIKNTTISYFQHSKLSKIEYIINQLTLGKNIALVTDAGTPGISDPGQALIHRIREISNSKFLISNQNPNSKISKSSNCHPELVSGSHGILDQIWNDNKEIKIIPIPGSSALTAAASVSGMIEKEFYFAGFLPKKKGRQTKFKELSKLNVPIVIYESANRLEKALGEIREYFGDNTKVFIAREITKMFEEYWGGSVDEIIKDLPNHQLKGEVALIIKNNKIR
ncbi:MAG: ribosomal RNA small subunit methyltransferase I [Patescibacteria group bacterium]